MVFQRLNWKLWLLDNIKINTFIPPTCQTFYPATSNFDISLDGWHQNRFVGQVGSSYTSDMAIDGFSVDERVFIERNPAVSTATTTPALSSLEEAPYLVVAPNPFDQHIQVQTNLQGAVYYRVVNLQGQVVQEGLLQEPNLSLSSLHTGLYFLTIYNEQEQLTHKIVHQ